MWGDGMTVELGNSGASGYGYTDNENVGRSAEPRHASQPASATTEVVQPAEGRSVPEVLDGSHESNTDSGGTAQETRAADHVEVTEEIMLDRRDEVPGYERSASICINRAQQIARSLNHTHLSADHLMLALTMDQNARRVLERVGDVTQLREAAMQRLGHFGSAKDSSDPSSNPTSDLADIAKAAREAANEREQSVAISDLINAFPKLNGRLTYGSGDGLQAVALIEKIEKGLVPDIADSVNKIEAVALKIQSSQTVQRMLEDQSHDAEQRQIAFMEDIRRQVLETVDTKVGGALKAFSDANNEAVALEIQSSQTVQRMLKDLNSKQSHEAEQRQIAFMEDIRRQVLEAVDTKVGGALKAFSDANNEAVALEIQSSQTVQRMLKDLNSKQSHEAEQRQIAFMEDIRRQVLEAVDTKVGGALKEFSDALLRSLRR
jgi:low affinity Fe/Cu permease